MLLQGFIKVIVKCRDQKNLCTFMSCTRHPFEGHNIVHEDGCAALF